MAITTLALIPACGSTRSNRTASPAHQLFARLTIVYRPHGAYALPGQPDRTRRWTLTCGPPGGSHPDPSVACAEVAKHGSELYHPAITCLVIARGAHSAAVTGVIGPHRVAFTASTCAPAWRTLPVLLTGSP